jgi:S-disulfanyl-L-cysteine oxidoreductase SoxD
MVYSHRLWLLAFAATLLGAWQKPSSVWDGVYTADQAARGEAAYRENCASCHGAALEGKGQSPPLAGSDFISNWNGRNLGEIFTKMQDTMPADRPGKLGPPTNAAILAYILKANKFPAGSAELPSDAGVLAAIAFRSDRK